ncbi:type I-E CRISPR-associated protein Cse2/CasB [Amycolatopsis magusensis]|uniref:type I-E CRISPR-associated protein Cse2/CasB n=1 Tax=Amycolatopsis magusensis TaxID=882444 RepID=UPI0024A902C7|nr:type I-E CRISPR-associated protein Cse2/CasB [Amycolatopsis magusensis]MDI5982162.1 type I-E CRISPR-associated protein Cse2/CasB [Amycolatopsis magusensis]
MSTPLVDRRHTFINYLHTLHSALNSSIAHRQSESRRTLARLRRSLTGPRQEADAYKFVFQHEPPESEQDAWILIAGLFSLHPQSRGQGARHSTLGGSMGALAALRGTSASRRFEQLLALDRSALPHHLRQTIRLLATHDIPVDFARLLDDVIILTGSRYTDEQARAVRLRWARDYHRPPRATPAANSNDTESATTDPAN